MKCFLNVSYFFKTKIMVLRKCFLFLKIWSPQSIFLYRIVFGNNFYWFPGKMIGKFVLFFHLWKTCYNSNWSAPPPACSCLASLLGNRLAQLEHFPPACELSIYSFFNYAYFFLKKEQARSKLEIHFFIRIIFPKIHDEMFPKCFLFF